MRKEDGLEQGGNGGEARKRGQILDIHSRQ